MHEEWGDTWDQDTLDLLCEYIQSSSALSFEFRAQEYTDPDIDELRLRAGDYVSLFIHKLGF